MNRPARLFLATLVALLACATASVTPALATYGKIMVVKDLVPAADSGRFDLKVGSTTVRTRAGDGDYGSATVLAGTYTVSEAAASGTALADYASSIDCRRKGISIRSGTGTSLGGIQLKVGDEIVCTITNLRLGKVEIEKQTDPADSSASFDFSSALAGAFSLSDDGVKTVTRVTPNQGGSPYTVVESTTTGWRLTSVGCGSDGDSSGSVANRTASIRVSPGETVHCKFVNTQIVAAIDVVKDGPALVHHGDSMTFGFAVTNHGNSPLHDVHVSDDHCSPVSETPTEKRDDDGDSMLEPGETWIFTCTMPVPEHAADEEDPIHNVATATGYDEWDRLVTDTAEHDTDILHSPPPAPPALEAAPPALEPAPEIHVLGVQALSGRAALSGPSGCTARAFTAVVRGRQIRRVTFYLDGRRFRQVNARTGWTRFTARIRPAGRALGVHRVTARVVFVRASGTRARTLVLTFQRCASRVARPVFTG
jgi:hypothetical protein